MKIRTLFITLVFLTVAQVYSSELNFKSELFKSAIEYGISDLIYWDATFNSKESDNQILDLVKKKIGKQLDATVWMERDQSDSSAIYYTVVVPEISSKIPTSSYTLGFRYIWDGQHLSFVGSASLLGNLGAKEVQKIKVIIPKNWETIASRFSGGKNEELIIAFKKAIAKLFQADGIEVKNQHFFIAPYDRRFTTKAVFFWVEKKQIIETVIKPNKSAPGEFWFEPMATKTIDLGERDSDEKLGKSIEYSGYLSYLLTHCIKDGIFVEFSR